MPFVPAPNIIMVECRMLLDSQKIENRFMIDQLATPSPADVEAAAIAGWNWWEDHYAAVLSNQVHLREVVATDLTTITGSQFTYAPDTTTVGGVGGPVLPNEVALCVSLRTGNRGRSARGRMFVPGIPYSALSTANAVSDVYAGNCTTAVTALITAYSPDTPLVIVSYRSEGAPRPGGPVYFPVTSAITVDNIVDSQRRRRPGIGT